MTWLRVWLYHRLKRHSHRYGPVRQFVVCGLFDWAAGMPLRVLFRDLWGKLHRSHDGPVV